MRLNQCVRLNFLASTYFSLILGQQFSRHVTVACATVDKCITRSLHVITIFVILLDHAAKIVIISGKTSWRFVSETVKTLPLNSCTSKLLNETLRTVLLTFREASFLQRSFREIINKLFPYVKTGTRLIFQKLERFFAQQKTIQKTFWFFPCSLQKHCTNVYSSLQIPKKAFSKCLLLKTKTFFYICSRY